MLRPKDFLLECTIDGNPSHTSFEGLIAEHEESFATAMFANDLLTMNNDVLKNDLKSLKGEIIELTNKITTLKGKMNNYVTAEEKLNQDNKKYMFLKEYKMINEAELSNDLLEIRVSEKNYFNDMTLALDRITPDQVLETKWQIIISDPGAIAYNSTGFTKSDISKFIDEYIKNEFEASANGVGLLPKAEFNSQTRKFKPFYYCILKSLTLDMKLPNSISDVYFKVKIYIYQYLNF
ncbi:hypothetical protein HDU92_005505 [Lobulomyces angularis]|nr:hypothetical protein HDU92_005505 [Lobulomyces angularis]